MSEAQVVTVITQAMLLVARIAGPILLAALVVGLAVSIFQSLTQVNDYTLTFAPKLLVIALVIAVGGHWMLSSLTDYTANLYDSIPRLVGG